MCEDAAMRHFVVWNLAAIATDDDTKSATTRKREKSLH